jgi:hypothetical protein
MMKPQIGQPSFMSSKDSLTDIEEILKRKVDQRTIKDFLGNSLHIVGEENFSLASHRSKQKAQFETKAIKVNLVEEYKNHLEAVGKM